MNTRNDNRAELANRLRRARHAEKLTMHQVAKMTGLSQSKVSRIELGNTIPSSQDLFALCKAFNLQPSVRTSLLHLLDSMAKPVRVLPTHGARRFSQTDFAEIVRESRRSRIFMGPYLFGFAQLPDYMLQVRPADVNVEAPGRFVSNKMRIYAGNFSSDNDDWIVMDGRTLIEPNLRPELWVEQLRFLRLQLRHVHAAFGIVPDSGSRATTAVSIYDRAVTLTEWTDEYGLYNINFDRSAAAKAERQFQAQAERAVWGSEAVDLVEAAVRRYEMKIDLREPQRYY